MRVHYSNKERGITYFGVGDELVAYCLHSADTPRPTSSDVETAKMGQDLTHLDMGYDMFLLLPHLEDVGDLLSLETHKVITPNMTIDVSAKVTSVDWTCMECGTEQTGANTNNIQCVTCDKHFRVGRIKIIS